MNPWKENIHSILIGSFGGVALILSSLLLLDYAQEVPKTTLSPTTERSETNSHGLTWKDSSPEENGPELCGRSTEESPLSNAKENGSLKMPMALPKLSRPYAQLVPLSPVPKTATPIHPPSK